MRGQALSLVLLLGVASGARAQGPDRPSDRIAFVGVTVVPADRQRVIADQTVVVEGGRITQLGPSKRIKVPPGATEVPGQGKFLMPGIAEMHGHLPEGKAPPEIVQQWMTLFVANGVTTVRGVRGALNQPALRDSIERGELLGPRLVVFGPPLEGKDLTPEEAVRRVLEYKKAGFEGLKISEGLGLPTYQAVMAAAKQQGLPVAGHVPNHVGLERALAAGQKSIEHLDGYIEALAGDDLAAKGPDGEASPPRTRVSVSSWVALDKVDEKRIPHLAAATRRAGAVVVPTMVVWRTLLGDFDLAELERLPELPYFAPRSVLEWTEDRRKRSKEMDPLPRLRRFMEIREHLLKALADAGTVVLGSDAPQMFSVPGFSLRHETAAMVKAGLTPWQVVQAATSAPARYFGRDKQQGTVAVGQRADLILTDGNPLDDVANIFKSSGVMVNGRWLPRAELDRKLAEIASVLRFPSDKEVKDLPITKEEAAPLTGDYRFDDNTLTVAMEKERLMLTARDKSGARTLRLRSQGGGVYLMPEVKARVTFELTQGRAAALVGNQGGAQFRAARLP